MAQANGSKQKSGLNQAMNSTSFVMLEGSGLARDQLVTIRHPVRNPNKTWRGSLVAVNTDGTLAIARVDRVARAKDEGEETPPVRTPDTCSVSVDNGTSSNVDIDIYS
jgi:hypothetical protein